MKDLNLENIKNFVPQHNVVQDKSLPKINKIYTLNGNILTEQSATFKEQVKFLCDKIHTVEWSGILFYTMVGEFPNIQKITLEEIFLMDKGSSVYTSYEFDSNIVNYIMDNPKLSECNIGHIHSHNTMSTFFSGTDMDELKENCFNHINYLSVIVNNMGSITGKMVMVTQLETDLKLPIKGSSNFINLNKKLKQNILLIKDCEFPLVPTSPLLTTFFKDRFETINKKPVFQTGYPYINNYNHFSDKTHSTINPDIYNKQKSDFIEKEEEDYDEALIELARDLWVEVLAKFFTSKKDLKELSWENNRIILKTLFKKHKNKENLLSKFKVEIEEIFCTEENSMFLDIIYDELLLLTNEVLEQSQVTNPKHLNEPDFDFFITQILNYISYEV
jgi:hypothetical protein